jgi:hypothetical protein
MAGEVPATRPRGAPARSIACASSTTRHASASLLGRGRPAGESEQPWHAGRTLAGSGQRTGAGLIELEVREGRHGGLMIHPDARSTQTGRAWGLAAAAWCAAFGAPSACIGQPAAPSGWTYWRFLCRNAPTSGRRDSSRSLRPRESRSSRARSCRLGSYSAPVPRGTQAAAVPLLGRRGAPSRPTSPSAGASSSRFRRASRPAARGDRRPHGMAGGPDRRKYIFARA